MDFILIKKNHVIGSTTPKNELDLCSIRVKGAPVFSGISDILKVILQNILKGQNIVGNNTTPFVHKIMALGQKIGTTTILFGTFNEKCFLYDQCPTNRTKEGSPVVFVKLKKISWCTYKH